MIYISILLSIIFTAEPLVVGSNGGNIEREIGEFGFPSDPMYDRAKGFLIYGKAKTGVDNYGKIISWSNHPSGAWGEYTYLPSLGFMAGVRGHRYSSEFSWYQNQEILGENIWCSDDLYEAWNLDVEELAYQDESVTTMGLDSLGTAIRVNGNFIGIVLNTIDDRGEIAERKSDVENLPLDMWSFNFDTNSVCLATNSNPNESISNIGIMYPWALRPALDQRNEEYDLYEYGLDEVEYTEDDKYLYYGSTVSESWFTRWNPDINTDWQATVGSSITSHNPATTVSDIFNDISFIEQSNWPLLSHSLYSETWASNEEGTPSWSGFNIQSDNDVYMKFDDRWAHRGNMIGDSNEYEQTGYPMGIEVETQIYSYGSSDYEDIIIFESIVSNLSHSMIMPDGTKLNQSNGFDYQDLSLGFYMDADVLSTTIDGSWSVHSNSDDFMTYIDCRTSLDFFPEGCPIIDSQEIIISMGVIGDWDGQSNAISGFAMDPDNLSNGSDFGLVALQMLDSPIATDAIDLDNDGFIDIYPGEKLKMTDWHWFDWYNRPGVVYREGISGCCAGDPGKDQARNKEEIMYKIMVGDTTNLSEDEKEWFFHADPLLDHEDPMFNPHFDSVEDLEQTDSFLDGAEGLDCTMMMSTGTFGLNAGESTKITYALIFGDNYEDLIFNAESAQILYNSFDNEDLSNNYNSFNPNQFYLDDPYPNPFNPVVSIKYSASNISNITFAIYDIDGRMVNQFNKGVQNPGDYSFNWDASNYASGIYFIKMIADNKIITTKKITLIK
tara:strand:- start:271 stop:2607 length:2337 start_codon:yes stop_codon:yes gene_type:complete